MIDYIYQNKEVTKMSAIIDAYEAFMKLSHGEKTSFYNKLTKEIIVDTDSIEGILVETRFSAGVKCLRCGSTNAVKNGKRPDGIQRYLCRDCKRSFLATTDSLASGTRKDYGVWVKYMECMAEKKTLKESAADCDISVGTAFLWRHKILDCLKKVADSVALGGIVEADETYFNISYKGNHHQKAAGKKTPVAEESEDIMAVSGNTDPIPRKPHERGGDVHTKGLSSEKVCVMCAVDKDGIPVTMAAKPGKVSSDCVTKAFTGRLLKDTVLCTDNEKAYIAFAKESGFTLIQMDTGRRMKGDYGIQRINAYHTKLKGFLDIRLRGVSSKYLGNYLAWHDLMFCGRVHDKKDDALRLLTTAFTEKYSLPCRRLSERPAVPCPAG